LKLKAPAVVFFSMEALVAIRMEMQTNYRALDNWDISSGDSSTAGNLFILISMWIVVSTRHICFPYSCTMHQNGYLIIQL
jgi:hypothetical protein